MHLQIIILAVSEKLVHPSVCEIFHGHRMTLSGLHGNVCMLTNLIVAKQISLKSMSALMRNHIDITARSVKICEDKWCLIIRKIGHITTLAFCLASQHIKKFMFHHKVEELSCFRRKLMVHLLSGFEDFLRSSDRIRISTFDIYVIIVIF